METVANAVHREPWNKGKLVGQKAPFKLKDIWALRVRLQMEDRVRELVAVGTGIAPRPPHRSVRAELPHTAPALSHDAKRSLGYG